MDLRPLPMQPPLPLPAPPTAPPTAPRPQPRRDPSDCPWDDLAPQVEACGARLLGTLAEEAAALDRDLERGWVSAERPPQTIGGVALAVEEASRKVKRFGSALHAAASRRVRACRRALEALVRREPGIPPDLVEFAHGFNLRLLSLFGKTASALGRSLDSYAAELDLGAYLAGGAPAVPDPRVILDEIRECSHGLFGRTGCSVREFNALFAAAAAAARARA